MNNNVHSINSSPSAQTSSGDGGNGNGKDISARVAVIESELKHLATKQDISDVKTLILERESSMQRWLIGILLTALVALIIAVVRTFSS
ncbi:MAG: hypothetical protein OXE41_04205 [Gammaproteobacteria bacterium]|nr:hypothetical protein [Gammaproteobacteria bacterium]MCY4274585.1 hypothetical protein [Gammaproteobacteria bacterium]